MKRAALVALLALGAAPAKADEAADLAAKAREIIQVYSSRLQSALASALAEGGPAKAISVCRTAAPEIASELAEDGWLVRRTSLKVRNPGNAPDAFEERILRNFEERFAEGAPVDTLGYYQLRAAGEQYEFRYVKAIETREMCLACHGAQLAPEVVKALDREYPTDQARGFSVGDIRGAFSLVRRYTEPMAEY